VKNKTSISHDEATVLALARDPEFARDYLNATLADGDNEEFMLALGRLVRARGAMRYVAGAAQVNVQTLYRTLSRIGNPQLDTLRSILSAVGFRLQLTDVRVETSESIGIAETIMPFIHSTKGATSNVVIANHQSEGVRQTARTTQVGSMAVLSFIAAPAA
jgi:probable addiction module antidote protein